MRSKASLFLLDLFFFIRPPLIHPSPPYSSVATNMNNITNMKPFIHFHSLKQNLPLNATFPGSLTPVTEVRWGTSVQRILRCKTGMRSFISVEKVEKIDSRLCKGAETEIYLLHLHVVVFFFIFFLDQFVICNSINPPAHDMTGLLFMQHLQVLMRKL